MYFQSDAELNQFLYQLNNLYSTSGAHGMYDLVYDKLIESGRVVKFNEEIKLDLRKKALKLFNQKEKKLIKEFKVNKWPEDKLKALFHKYFKSILAAKYIMDKLEKEDITFVLKNDLTGKEVKALNIVGYK